MSYQEEEQARLIRQRSKQAIALAMQGRWREAVAANKSLLDIFPNDIDTYNRLGRAYMELGEYSQSMESYRRAAELDPYNVIAQKNLKRLSHLEGAGVGLEDDSQQVEPQHFIEETGKAGVVNLCRLGSPEVLARMVAGDKVYLEIDGSNLIVENGRGEYLGQVEPKHGLRLVRLMQGGNRYTAAVIRSTGDMMTIIIREIHQEPGQAGQLSFPPRALEGIRPYVSERIPRREREYEEEAMEEISYAMTGEDETELLPDEPSDIEDKPDSEE
jgi:tetratricopeptide (TPR) repeat protein